MHDFSQACRVKKLATYNFNKYLITPDEFVEDFYPHDEIMKQVDELFTSQRDQMDFIIPLLHYEPIHTTLATHMYNVASVAFFIAEQMGYSEKQIKEITLAGALHDIGKKFISTDVLDKTSKLSPAEIYAIHTHPKLGEFFVKEHYPKMSDDVLQAILMHHEKLDGNGYYQVKNENITSYARLISVADIFCAITETRTYHAAHSFEEGLSILTNEQGIDTQYIAPIKDQINLSIAI
ncbi:HD-GYP domain-containing protein (plasmid) [Butyrivibrio proteoclasticus B316]|uniref:HD-GYP domain-containing protein n=1 Tax=Butyrivibrio proteoclasticus (strain ATCC 51982 / DSM 14932 / B316) TaxID=515622 RepID=E0S453_BUTPB|nr:HD domain-containing phosphohydrolase [Butyrivibrio proteoclasticus]ADL36185.1 HD-GYP domain-containing protein [Butyrivibrio proteoclasticus B316]